MEANDVDDGTDARPPLLACLDAIHMSRRQISQPGRHLIAIDMDEGVFNGGDFIIVGSSYEEEDEEEAVVEMGGLVMGQDHYFPVASVGGEEEETADDGLEYVVAEK